MFIYGQSGVGKTSLAKTMSGETLIVSLESGLLSLADSDIDYVVIEGKTAKEKVQNVRDIVKELQGTSLYKNIFIDSMTELSQIFIEYQFDLINNDKSKTLPAYGDYNKMMRVFIKTVRDMGQYNIVMTALEKTDKDEVGRRFTIPDLVGNVSHAIPQFFDEVFHYQIIEKEEKQHRFLLTGGHQSIVAKDRSGKLAQYEKPNLGDIFKKIQGEKQ
jgi:phage nucleotide-binding protein